MDKIEELEEMIKNNGIFTQEYENKAINCLGEIACNFRNICLDNDRNKEIIEDLRHKNSHLNDDIDRLRKCIDVLLYPEKYSLYD